MPQKLQVKKKSALVRRTNQPKRGYRALKAEEAGVSFYPSNVRIYEIANSPTGTLVETIRAGIKAHVVPALAADVGIASPAAAKMLGMSPRTLNDLIRRKSELAPADSERAIQFAQVIQEARKLFATPERIKEWLETPAPALDSKRPIDLLDTATGAGLVKEVLLGIGHGIYQ